MSVQAIILAGGLGTRLRSTVGEVPKVLAPVAGRPFLEHLLEDLETQGFSRVILAVGWRMEVIQRHFGNAFGRLDIQYSMETEPLGTGGAAQLALQSAEDGPCFLLNGDTWLDVDYRAMQLAHIESAATLSVAVKKVPDVGRFGALELKGNRVTRFREKGARGPGFINAGVYLLNHGIFESLSLPRMFSLERDFLEPHLDVLSPRANLVTGRFIDIGIPEDYARAQALLLGS